MAIDAENVYDVSDLKVGETVVGRVQNITDFGAFIKVGTVTGLLHISNMSWEHVDDIEEIVHEGDDIEVKILKVDIAADRVEFGLKQLTERPKPVERRIANAIAKAELKVGDAGDEEVYGDIYVRFASEDVEEKMRERVEKMVASHAGSFSSNGSDDSYEQISSVLFEESISRTYFVSNASTTDPHNCRERNCPLGGVVENCALAKSCCSVVILRPACDTPRMVTLFPGNEVLGIMAFVEQCPHKDNGSVVAIFGLTWMPKCDRRPFETRMSGRMIWSNTRPLDRRPGNVFNAQVIERLSPISVVTQRNLTTWREYLAWRNKLLKIKKMGVRYVDRRFDAKSRSVVFTIVGPQNPNRFWLREDVGVVPLKNSIDKWQYQEDSSPDAWKKRTRMIPLGRLSSKDVVRTDVNHAALKAAECPWNDPYIADISFSLDDDLMEGIDSQFDDSASDEEVEKSIENQLTLPENGFLMVSATGDETLIRRQQSVLEKFEKEGSVASPFLTSYLFDITKARVPASIPQITDFLKKDLNDSQKQAVSMMVAAPDIALVQGPPGTGKTTVIAEAIWQFVKQGKRVLLVSQSGAAVDNALDRLENIPAIRAIRLKKETTYSRNESDGGRYAKDSVLENFYSTLAKSAKVQLDYWRSAEDRIQMLSRTQTDLTNFLDRLAREDSVMSEFHRDEKSAEHELEQSNQELASRRTSAVMVRQISEFIAFLSGGEFPSELCVAGVDVPKVIVDAFENFLRNNLESLASMGIQLFVTPYNVGWPASQKMLSVKNALEQLKVLQREVLPDCEKDIARLKGQVGEAVVSDADALKIADLQRKLDEVERQENEEVDDDRWIKLGRQRRELRKQINDLKRSAGFSVEQYKRALNVPDAEGRDVVDWLSKPERTRSELLGFLEEWHERVLCLVNQVESAKKTVVDSLSSATNAVPDVDEAERKAAQCQRKVTDVREKIAESEKRCAPVRVGLKRVVDQLSLRVGISFQDGNAACEWCLAEVKRQQDNLNATASERKWREPLLKSWVDRLSQISKSDEELVLPDYLKTCSVVGMTCTSDNRLLTDNGYDRFDVVIIDEVSKATPPELLMSMVLAEKAILVGDHRQLPPLFGDKEPKGMEEIIQQQEEDAVPEAQRITKESFRKYQGMVEASLFKQHFEQADARLKSSLWHQYRMHPDIQNLVNLFYENRLVCGMENPDKLRDHLQSAERVPWMRNKGHAYWIDSSTDPNGIPFYEPATRIGSTSKENPLEVKLMFKALEDLDNSLDAYARTLPPDLAKNVTKTVGIISFYGLQVGALKNEFEKHRFKRIKCRRPVTVDKFQGQECDYILVSMTRHPSRKQNLSHVAKFERINVAFSRARELLLIFGARDVFVDCDVALPPLDRPGNPEKVPVYRRMIDLLTREGRMLSAGDLISRDEWKAIAATIVRGERNHGTGVQRHGGFQTNGNRPWGSRFNGKGRGYFKR